MRADILFTEITEVYLKSYNYETLINFSSISIIYELRKRGVHGVYDLLSRSGKTIYRTTKKL